MKKSKILIAEGDDVLRQNLKKLLLRHGFEVLESFNKTEILRFFQNTNPDLIIVVSSQKDEYDELDVAQSIRLSDQKIPIILITANSSEDLAIKALKIGIN